MIKVSTYLIVSVLVFCVLANSAASYAQGLLRQKLREKPAQRSVDVEQGIISTENGLGSGDRLESLIVDGRPRTYIIHCPPKHDSNTPASLVLVFHGGGGNAENAMRMTGMSGKADKEDFIVVYPNGTGRFEDRFLTWNTWNCCAYALEHGVDDVKFVNKLIEKIEKEYKIDPKRIFAAGISNGGMMSYRLAVESSDKIAAVAPVSGALNCDNPSSAFPVSIIAFHGTADEHVPYNGGTGKSAFDKNRVDKPVSYAISSWVKLDACNTKALREESGSIIKERYIGGKAGTEVVLYTINGGGHAWPGGKPGRRFGNVDQPTQEINATDIIWEFFKSHPKE